MSHRDARYRFQVISPPTPPHTHFLCNFFCFDDSHKFLSYIKIEYNLAIIWNWKYNEIVIPYDLYSNNILVISDLICMNIWQYFWKKSQGIEKNVLHPASSLWKSSLSVRLSVLMSAQERINLMKGLPGRKCHRPTRCRLCENFLDFSGGWDISEIEKNKSLVGFVVKLTMTRNWSDST